MKIQLLTGKRSRVSSEDYDYTRTGGISSMCRCFSDSDNGSKSSPIFFMSKKIDKTLSFSSSSWTTNLIGCK